jgi:hypothetical protein
MADQVGMSLVVDILLKSLVAKGKLVEHIQFATLWKLQAIHKELGIFPPWGQGGGCLCQREIQGQADILSGAVGVVP